MLLFVSVSVQEHMVPTQGDKIMVFKEKWVNLLLNGTKTMETRGRPLKEGMYWIGSKKKIWGKLHLGKAKHIETVEEWRNLRLKHCCETDDLPYKKSWCFDVSEVVKMTPVPFLHPKGAISIVRYRE